MTRSRLSTDLVCIFLIALFITPALLEGCSQSQMTELWKDPSYTEGSLKKVFTIAVRKDPVRRRIWEDAFVEELKAHGVPAIASYTMFPSVVPGLHAGERRRTQGGF